MMISQQNYHNSNETMYTMFPLTAQIGKSLLILPYVRTHTYGCQDGIIYIITKSGLWACLCCMIYCTLVTL